MFFGFYGLGRAMWRLSALLTMLILRLRHGGWCAMKEMVGRLACLIS